MKLLDLGGTRRHAEITHIPNIDYTCLNLRVYTGRACSKMTCEVYDGETIAFEENSFDIVLTDMVLHHASENAIGLVRQMHKVASKYVVIII